MNEVLKMSVEGMQSRCCHCVVYDLAVSCLFPRPVLVVIVFK